MAIQTIQFRVVLAIGFSLASATLNAVAAESTTTPKLLPSLELDGPEDVTVARGHPAVLRCGARSQKGDHQVRWYLNGTLISGKDGRWQIFKNGTLFVPKVAGKRMNTSLEGTYRCMAKNSDGALLSNSAQLKIATLKEFTEQPKDINGTDSQPIVIPCSINSYPTAIVTWERDEFPLPQDKRYVPLPTGSLLITSVHSSDSGSYRCIVENTVLKKKKSSRSGRLEIRPGNPNVVIPPAILPVDIDFNVTTLVGNDVALYCIVNGWPKPSIKWLHDNIVIGNSHVLSLKNVSLSDFGRYTCLAQNSGGQIIEKYFVSVNQIPRFNFTPISMVYPIAKTIRLECQGLGVPKPEITWYKNGEPFFTNSTFGRAYEQWNGLLISYSVASDAGLYQCVATNPAGSIRASAMVKLNYSAQSPSPPLDVHCQSLNDTSICLTWNGVPNAQAYSILPYYSGVRLRDYVTNATFKIADNLLPNTNYTFSLRTYSNEASNEFVRVSCRTGKTENRKLTVKQTSENSVRLNWTQIVTDSNYCMNKTTVTYKVQWKRTNQTSINIQHVTGTKWMIAGLKPKTTYVFRVQSDTQNEESSWIEYTLVSMVNLTDISENELDSSYYANETASLLPVPPAYIEATPLSTRSINLTWAEADPPLADVYYTICYVAISENKDCESGKIVKSFKNYIEIVRLKPKTIYEFRVQTHTTSGLQSGYSYSVQVSTSSDLPSSVQGLKYAILNSTAACLMWEPPLNTNGKLTGYLIKYSPNNSWTLEQWHTVNVNTAQKNKGCSNSDSSHQGMSVALKNLNPNKEYMVIVVAINDAGRGSPTMPVTLSTSHPLVPEDYQPAKEEKIPLSKENMYYKQGIGVILGLSLSLISMIIFLVCFLLRKRYLKTLPFSRGRGNNHCRRAGVAGVGMNGGADIVQRGNCVSDAHEMENLVEGNGTIFIPTHIDTKGGSEFPNGQLNGNLKKYHTNGNTPNSHIHITENPQYYTNEDKNNCGELQRLNPPSRITDSYEEDSNSNFQKLTLAKIIDREKPAPYHLSVSPIVKINNLDRNCDSSSVDSNLDTLMMNCTQLTTIDDVYRKIPLGPNG